MSLLVVSGVGEYVEFVSPAVGGEYVVSVDISVVVVDDRGSETEGRLGSAEVDDQTDVDVVALR